MKKPIINLNEIELQPPPPPFAATGEAAERYDASMGLVAQALGAQKLGYNITTVRPGRRAFPFHSHRVNEEMFFILDGTGEIRIGDTVFQIQQNDIIACPPGGEETAHQIINTGKVDLKYLAVSTNLSPEIANFPDSGKFAILAEYPPDTGGKPQRFMFVGRESDNTDYWEGE